MRRPHTLATEVRMIASSIAGDADIIDAAAERSGVSRLAELAKQARHISDQIIHTAGDCEDVAPLWPDLDIPE